MAGVVLPWSVHTADREQAARVIDAVFDLPAEAPWGILAPATIPRSLAELGEIERLTQFDGYMDAAGAAVVEATRHASRGFLALAADDTATAVDAFRQAIEVERRRGADQLAACAELDLAAALEAAGDSDGAIAARSSSRAVLDPLGCVDPF